MNQYKVYSDKLANILGMTILPIAARFIKDDEKIPEGYDGVKN